MKVFFKTLYEGICKVKRHLSNYMTDNEQKILFFLLLVIVAGAMLHFYEYTPAQREQARFITANRDSLRAIVSTDFIMRYDVNKVTYDELLYIDGIGPSTATAIITHQQNTGFRSIDDLLQIRGIGAVRLNNFKEFLYVEGEKMTPTPAPLPREEVFENGLPLTELASIRRHRGRIHLLDATIDDFTQVRGIGTATAERIIDFISQNNVQSIDDLLAVSGIGARRLEDIKRYFYIEIENTSNAELQIVDNTIEINDVSNTYKININEATQEELVTLRGIGAVRANDIIEYRTRHGRFRRIEDIQNVRGIGTRTYENIRDFITIGD